MTGNRKHHVNKCKNALHNSPKPKRLCWLQMWPIWLWHSTANLQGKDRKGFSHSTRRAFFLPCYVYLVTRTEDQSTAQQQNTGTSQPLMIVRGSTWIRCEQNSLGWNSAAGKATTRSLSVSDTSPVASASKTLLIHYHWDINTPCWSQ